MTTTLTTRPVMPAMPVTTATTTTVVRFGPNSYHPLPPPPKNGILKKMVVPVPPTSSAAIGAARAAAAQQQLQPLKTQPPWEELIRQQAEVGQLQKKLAAAKLAAAAASQQRMLQLQQQQPTTNKSKTTTTTTNMAAYLLCLTAGGGVPLFTRRKGDLKTLPFPVVGSLNGVHMFGKTKEATLLSTVTKDAKVVWRSFHDSIMLILVTSDDRSDVSHLSRLLEFVFDSMVLLVGLDDLTRLKNVERLKRDLRCCYRLIDVLLEQTDADHCLYGPLSGTVDCLTTAHVQLLQNNLEAFVESTDSTYGCLVVHGRLVVATRKWWSLTAREASLLSVFVESSPRSTTRDIPVFLPVESPTVPHRLLTFSLLPHMEVCVLCGPTPSLAQLEKEVPRYWKNSHESLRSLNTHFPRCFPPTVVLDKNLLGFLLLNTENRRCLCSVQPTTEDSNSKTDVKQMKVKRRQEILNAFYKTTVGGFFQSRSSSSEAAPTEAGYKVYHTRLKHQATETYTCSDHHKCYAVWAPPHQLFALFNTGVPTFALRSVTHNTLQLLTKDKYAHV